MYNNFYVKERYYLLFTKSIFTGKWGRGYRAAYIEPDQLLIYRVTKEELYLARTGSHAELFKS
jgi:mRNA-degrading endonuclease YafQ of YafQ-DinJ toxin-antitoxin module